MKWCVVRGVLLCSDMPLGGNFHRNKTKFGHAFLKCREVLFLNFGFWIPFLTKKSRFFRAKNRENTKFLF